MNPRAVEHGAEAPMPGAGSRAESLTLASIYERHLIELRREQPDSLRIDASRLDAEVAVRMAVTGSLPRADRQGDLRRREVKSVPRGSRLAGLRSARRPTRVRCSR